MTLAGLDGETRRHWQAEFVAHEPKAKTLAAKARAQPRMGLAVPEIEKRDRWRRFQRPVSLARHRRVLSPQAPILINFFVTKALAFKSDTDIILLILNAASSASYEKTMSELAELSVEPLPSPPTQKGLAMRERLVKAAARAFRLRGYELTRVEDIAKAARTSYGNFYRHFRNKDEVLMAVLRPLLDEVYVASKRRRDPSARLTEDEFAANTVAFLRIYARHRELLRVMREAAARGEKASFYSMWIGERERFVRRTTAWLVRLWAAGAIDADIDPEVAAETLGALTEQLAYVKLGLAEETPSDAEIERLGSHSARIWYRGVFGHQRQASP